VLLPYALTVAAASFIYIALSDLLPEMMRRKSLRQSVPEVVLVLTGVALAALVMSGLHNH
jgi:zinc and cadmium transporter